MPELNCLPLELLCAVVSGLRIAVIVVIILAAKKACIVALFMCMGGPDETGPSLF